MSIFVNGIKSSELTDDQKREFLKVKMLKERHVPVVPKEYIWAHGLNAVNRSQSPAVALKKLLNILGTDAEISASKPGPENKFLNGGLGKIGVYIKGTVSFMCNVDCGSNVIDGKRYPCNIREEFIVDNYKDLDDTDGYTEVFIAPEQIVGFWVSANSYENYISEFETGKAAEKYKNAFGDDWELMYEFEYIEPRNDFVEALNMLKDMGIPMSFAW